MPAPSSKKKAAPRTAKLFQNGRSQAVRLPKEFRFAGTEVQIRRTKKGVLLEPAGAREKRAWDVQTWFQSMDELGAGEVMPGGRNQPPMQERDWFE